MCIYIYIYIYWKLGVLREAPGPATSDPAKPPYRAQIHPDLIQASIQTSVPAVLACCLIDDAHRNTYRST